MSQCGFSAKDGIGRFQRLFDRGHKVKEQSSWMMGYVTDEFSSLCCS